MPRSITGNQLQLSIAQLDLYEIGVTTLTATTAFITTENASTINVSTVNVDTINVSNGFNISHINLVTANVSTANVSTVNSSTINSSSSTIITMNSTTSNISTANISTSNSSTKNASTSNASTSNASTSNASTLVAINGTITTMNSTTGNVSTANISTTNSSTINASTSTIITMNSTTGNVSTVNSSTNNSSTINGDTSTITTMNSTTSNISTANLSTINASNINIDDFTINDVNVSHINASYYNSSTNDWYIDGTDTDTMLLKAQNRSVAEYTTPFKATTKDTANKTSCWLEVEGNISNTTDFRNCGIYFSNYKPGGLENIIGGIGGKVTNSTSNIGRLEFYCQGTVETNISNVDKVGHFASDEFNSTVNIVGQSNLSIGGVTTFNGLVNMSKDLTSTADFQCRDIQSTRNMSGTYLYLEYDGAQDFYSNPLQLYDPNGVCYQSIIGSQSNTGTFASVLNFGNASNGVFANASSIGRIASYYDTASTGIGRIVISMKQADATHDNVLQCHHNGNVSVANNLTVQNNANISGVINVTGDVNMSANMVTQGDIQFADGTPTDTTIDERNLTENTIFSRCFHFECDSNYRDFYMGLVGDGATNSNEFCIGANAGGTPDPNMLMTMASNGLMRLYRAPQIQYVPVNYIQQYSAQVSNISYNNLSNGSALIDEWSTSQKRSNDVGGLDCFSTNNTGTSGWRLFLSNANYVGLWRFEGRVTIYNNTDTNLEFVLDWALDGGTTSAVSLQNSLTSATRQNAQTYYQFGYDRVLINGRRAHTMKFKKSIYLSATTDDVYIRVWCGTGTNSDLTHTLTNSQYEVLDMDIEISFLGVEDWN